jgi:pimeloyl-ACP methyl ester carboxylesterase
MNFPDMSLFMVIAVVAFAIVLSFVLFTWRVKRRVESKVPPLGRFIDLPGAKLHVVERGQGPALLLVHGLAGQLRHFTYDLVDRLADHFRVVAVDRPGSGYSERPPDVSASLGAQADVMAALIDHLQLDRPVVVGHSMGGAVALALAQRHPERVSALALIAPLTHPVRQINSVFNGLKIARAWVRSAVAWTLAVPLSLSRRDQVLKVLFDPEPAPADFQDRGGGLLSLRPSHYIAACADFVAIPTDLDGMVQRYGEMRLPVSVLYGRGDRILDPLEQGEALASKLPGAELTLIDGGHMLPISSPQRTAQFIRDTAARVSAERLRA